MSAGIVFLLGMLLVVVGVPLMWGSARIAANAPLAVTYAWFIFLTALLIAGLVYGVMVALSLPL